MDERYLKQVARDRLRGRWGLSVGTAAIAVLLGGLIVGTTFFPNLEYGTEKFLNLGRLGETLSFSLNLLALPQFILGGALQLGYSKFLLKQHDGQEYEFRDLFSEFDRFGTGFAQAFLRGLYITLWTLLLIVPGIIAGYKYAMTPFILADYPDLTASQAIEASKHMMDGHKGELFVLDLSFLGWTLLAALSGNIGNLFLNPYRNAAYAAFYRELQAQQQAQREGY